MTSTIRNLVFRLLLLSFSSVFTFLFCEVAFRIISPEQSSYSVSDTGNQYAFYQYDAKLGWTNRPGSTGVYNRQEFKYSIKINKYGMRQSEVSKSKPADTKRIAVLGDSFVWGIGIPDKGRFTELIDDAMEGVEVLNFGVSGYSPIQFSMMMDRVLDFDPDVIIVVICLGNDFDDNVHYRRYGYYKPYAVLNDKAEIEIRGIPPHNVNLHLTERPLYGFRLIRHFYNLMLDKQSEEKVSDAGLVDFSTELLHESVENLSEPEQKTVASAIEINKQLLKRISDAANQKGVRLLITSAPSKLDYREGLTNADGKPASKVEMILEETCHQLNIEFLPSVAKLTLDDFWKTDGHWNPEGHKKLAAHIVAYLEQSSWLE